MKVKEIIEILESEYGYEFDKEDKHQYEWLSELIADVQKVVNGVDNPKKQKGTFIVLELFDPLFTNVHCNTDGETVYFDNKEDAKLVADQECQVGIVVDITNYV